MDLTAAVRERWLDAEVRDRCRRESPPPPSLPRSPDPGVLCRVADLPSEPEPERERDRESEPEPTLAPLVEARPWWRGFVPWWWLVLWRGEAPDERGEVDAPDAAASPWLADAVSGKVVVTRRRSGLGERGGWWRMKSVDRAPPPTPPPASPLPPLLSLWRRGEPAFCVCAASTLPGLPGLPGGTWSAVNSGDRDRRAATRAAAAAEADTTAAGSSGFDVDSPAPKPAAPKPAVPPAVVLRSADADSGGGGRVSTKESAGENAPVATCREAEVAAKGLGRVGRGGGMEERRGMGADGVSVAVAPDECAAWDCCSACCTAAACSAWCAHGAFHVISIHVQ